MAETTKQYPIEAYLSNRAAFGAGFNHDATKLVYLSNVDSDTSQIHVYSRIDGHDEYVSAYDENIGFAAFSPVDDTLVFSRDTGGNENHQIYLQSSPDSEPLRISRSETAQYQYGGWSRDGQTILLSSNERNGSDNDLFTYDVASGEYGLLHEGSGRVFAVGFSPSKRYVMVFSMASLADNDLYVIDREDGDSLTHLTPHDGKALYQFAGWLEDESGFFMTSDQDGDFQDLYFFDIEAMRAEPVKQYGWDVEGVSLARDNRTMIVRTNEDGYSVAHFYGLDGHTLVDRDPLPLPEGRLEEFVFSKDSKLLAFTRSSYDTGYNVWVYDGNVAKPITDMPQAVPAATMVESQLIRYKSFDGLSVPAFVYFPAGDGPFPALVSIHGGPEGQYQPGFVSLTQYYVSHGYAVIAPNVRGSTGYGKAYAALDDRDKRLDSVEDLRGLHSWAMQEPRIDERRIALMGGSYGGYMVLAGLAFQPELWAAGVDIVGIANLVTFLQNTSSYRRKLREAEYGSLEHDREMLKRVSPISRVDNIAVPVIVIHGKNDPRVPLNEAEQIYEKLRERGIESELLIYDDEGHGIAKLKNRLDVYPKIAAFLDHHVKDRD